jgi:hypothetical protein
MGDRPGYLACNCPEADGYREPGVANRRPPERREYYRTTPTVTSNQDAEIADFMGSVVNSCGKSAATGIHAGRKKKAWLRCHARTTTRRMEEPFSIFAQSRSGHPWPLAAFGSSLNVTIGTNTGRSDLDVWKATG